jgi:immunity protein 50 of polymorphic toxin system
MDKANIAPTGIANAEAVVSAFGFWPSFHDAEVHRATLDRGSGDEQPSITIVVHAFASDGSIDEKGYYRIVTSVLVTLKCRDVSASELYDLGEQNVLSSLDFEPTVDGAVRVTLAPCYGLSGSPVCSQVVVESVVPWRSPTEDASPVKPRP